MNMHPLDWSIVGGLVALLVVMALVTRRYTRSVADFLAAGRCARRYVISISEGIAMLGAITIVATFEMYHEAGFTALWWRMPMFSILFIASLLGWMIYRFRQTRAMTMAQFFEMRYSRRFRVFAGLLAFVSGTINFGIFPAVGARFFIYFCGLPDAVSIGPLSVSTFALIMFILLAVALLFTFLGGQVAVIVTDFIQGMFCMTMLLIVFVVLLRMFTWEQISWALAQAPEHASLVHPLHTSEAENFNITFFLIGMFSLFYNFLSWQGQQAYNCSALNAHEARMGKVLGIWRASALELLFAVVVVFAYTFLNHPDFAAQAAGVDTVLRVIDNPQIQTQTRVSVALSRFLPVGVMGGLCAVMLAAFISTHDTYLHSWGSIFIQDVVMPFRRKPFTPRQHLMLLRLSIAGVAVFVFLFGLLFRQNQHILQFFALTGTIYLGGAGAVIIGGLYWKRGTAAAAWWAMGVSALLAVAGIIVIQIDPDFPLKGQEIFGIGMAVSIILYVGISLLGRRGECDMNRILHRGRYAVEQNPSAAGAPAARWQEFRMGREFSRGDKLVYAASIAWTFASVVLFVSGIGYCVIADVEESSWMAFWRYAIWFAFAMGVVVTVWFMIGGLIDLKYMFVSLRTNVRDDTDDGMVRADEGAEVQPG